jgi:hypothetical protein
LQNIAPSELPEHEGCHQSSVHAATAAASVGANTPP